MDATIYPMLTFTAALIAALLAAYAWRHREKPGVVAFVALMLAVAEWSLTFGLSTLSAGPAAARFWFKAQFVGVATVPVIFFVFVLQYTGRGKWLARQRWLGLCLLPLLTQVVVWTDGAHAWFFQSIRFARQDGLMEVVEWTPGPWFKLHTAYSYGLLFLSVLRIGLTALRSHHLYRRQAFVLLLAVLPPLAGNVVITLKLIPGLEQSVPPVSFTLMGLVLAWDLFGYRLLDVTPVARDALIDSMGDGMLVLDAQDRVVDLNPALQTMLGLTSAQAVGRPAPAVLRPWPALVERLEDASSVQAEVALDQRYYDLRISPVAGWRGRLKGRLLVLREVTELRRHTLELEASNAELDAFAHTVAHGLKNPLSSVIGYAEMVKEGLTSQPVAQLRQDLDRVSWSGRKMTRIVDELLLLASVRRRQDVDVVPLDMAAIVTEALDRLNDDVAAQGAEIVLPDMQAWPVALGYAPWVEEVWVNYLSNALKYGGVPPRVALGAVEFVDGGRPTARFWVRDNGAGLTPDQQELVFTPFTRLHEVQVEGHGLGLSIVQRIVHRLDGTVGVESPGLPGQGCTFYFALPSAT